MITGAIAIIFLIAAIVAASNGEWGSFAIGAVIVVVLLGIGSASREDARAHVNWMHYWADGGPEGERRRAEEERRRKVQREKRRTAQTERVATRSVNGGIETAGRIMRMQDTTYPCPACGHQMQEFKRIGYSSGSEFVTYRCHRCGKELPVKVK